MLTFGLSNIWPLNHKATYYVIKPCITTVYINILLLLVAIFPDMSSFFQETAGVNDFLLFGGI